MTYAWACNGTPWHMPWHAMSHAVASSGICHGMPWHMPWHVVVCHGIHHGIEVGIQSWHGWSTVSVNGPFQQETAGSAYAMWCGEQTRRKKEEIAAGNQKIEELNAAIEESYVSDPRGLLEGTR